MIFALAGIVLAVGTGLWAPNATCGDPATVNQAYPAYQALVIEALDPVTLVVAVDEQPPGFASLAGCSTGPCKVRLVNLDPPADPTLASLATRHLGDLCKTKKVSLEISPQQQTPGVVNAIVEVGDLRLNEAQLESGFATYRSVGPFAVDWFVECMLEHAQSRAREKRRGLWGVR
jgi:endonuclease YncB( thermonuclease family)